MEVFIDLSIVGLAKALEFERCPDADTLIISPIDYFFAKELLTLLRNAGRKMYFIKCQWLPDDTWLVGKIADPNSFVGSPGA